MSLYDDTAAPQPTLTSHEQSLRRVGPSRGKQRYDVQRPERDNTRRTQAGQGSPRPPFKPASRPQKPKVQRFDHDVLLQTLKGQTLTIWLGDDTLLKAKLLDGDRYTLLMEVEGHRELVFKSAIAQIVLDGGDAE